MHRDRCNRWVRNSSISCWGRLVIINSIPGAIFLRNTSNGSIDPIRAMANLFLSASCGLEFEISTVCTKSELQKLFYQRTDGNFEIDFSSERAIPVRRCKKRRIQKKWIKKYGMKAVYANKRTLLANNISVTENGGYMFNESFVYVVFGGEI